MSFIHVQQSLVTHRKALRLARLLALDRYAVVGRLVALWAWCLENAPDGCLGEEIDADILADVLADVMGWDAALGRPAELLEALLTAGFLELNAEDGRLSIHDWRDWMAQSDMSDRDDENDLDELDDAISESSDDTTEDTTASSDDTAEDADELEGEV